MSSLFNHLDSTDRQLRTEYEAIWHLALLAGKPLGQYRPSIGRLYQQSLSPLAAPSVTVWQHVHYKTLMLKVRSLLWTIHANTYWTAAKLAAFTSVSPVCLQCGQHTEIMAHALIDCQSVRPFWANVLSFISGQVDPMPDVDAILQPRLPTDMHTHSLYVMVYFFSCGEKFIFLPQKYKYLYSLPNKNTAHFLPFFTV
jgi:hypothetical protein